MSDLGDMLTLAVGGGDAQASQVLGGEAADVVMGSLNTLRGLTECNCAAATYPGRGHLGSCLAEYRPDVESLDAALAVLVFALAGASS
jgi:hypothetical protein